MRIWTLSNVTELSFSEYQRFIEPVTIGLPCGRPTLCTLHAQPFLDCIAYAISYLHFGRV